jgi:hypothetical protein
MSYTPTKNLFPEEPMAMQSFINHCDDEAEQVTDLTNQVNVSFGGANEMPRPREGKETEKKSALYQKIMREHKL